MKKIFIILTLVVSVLFVEGKNSWASENFREGEEQNKIRKLILDNIPDHTFPPSERAYESGGMVQHKITINLINEDLTDENMKGLVEKIITDPHREEIQILNLNNNKIGNSGAISLASSLDYLKGLEELDVSGNKIELFGLQSIFVKAPNLKKLSFIKYSGEEKDIPELEKLSESKIEPSDKNFIAHFNKQD